MSRRLRLSFAAAGFALVFASSSPALAGGSSDPVVNDADEFGPSSDPSPIDDGDEASNGTILPPSLLLVPIDGEDDGTPGTEPGGDGDETP